MPSRRVAAELNSGTSYLTLTVQRWYYLFNNCNWGQSKNYRGLANRQSTTV